MSVKPLEPSTMVLASRSTPLVAVLGMSTTSPFREPTAMLVSPLPPHTKIGVRPFGAGGCDRALPAGPASGRTVRMDLAEALGLWTTYDRRFRDDPYPVFAVLRRHGPVHRVPLRLG